MPRVSEDALGRQPGMSRSSHSPRRSRERLYGANKRVRHAVQQVLLPQARLLDEEKALVWADRLEELGKLTQAEALRRGEDLVLPTAPAGFNTRLRW